MDELMNCPNCESIFVKSKFRDVCERCYREEELEYEKVYQYIKKRQNRTASIAQVVEATGVDEDLIVKFLKNGKLKQTQFPNLAPPCEKCGAPVMSGRICVTCKQNMETDLKVFEHEENRKKEIAERDKRVTFYTKHD